MRILHLDTNHPFLIEELRRKGFVNDVDIHSSKEEIEKKIHNYQGLIIRSRFPVDKQFLTQATQLKFIGRVGAGMENIDIECAKKKNIRLYNAPEGNRNAVAEHCIGMLLSLLNRLNQADRQVRVGIWDREANRGVELKGKTIGIIGYGFMGKAFAKKISGFNVRVLCHDILSNVGDEYAQQVSLEQIFEETDILSLHIPQTPKTIHLLNESFLSKFQKKIYLVNTARGICVNTSDLINAIEKGIILGACLDVLEFEQSSFERLFYNKCLPMDYRRLIESDRVLLSPHVAGLTKESYLKMAQVIATKILEVDFSCQKQSTI